MNQQDWNLMRDVAAGDDLAVAALYDRFGSLVYKTARQVLPSRAEAEDAVQEVFVKLWQSADRYDPRRARLITWVMLITRRHLIDRLRRRSSRPSLSGIEPDQGGQSSAPLPEERRMVDDRASALRRKVAELPDLQRQVIERAYFQGFTLREVSEQLGAPLGTVKSALSRGLARLRETAAADDRAL